MNESSPAFNLDGAISINEILKQVIDTACRIDLVAVNAVLVAKRAGTQSAGFHVVALELRTFGLEVEKEMAILGKLIYRFVHRIAALLKLARNLRLLEATEQKSDQAHSLIHTRVESKRLVYQQTLIEAEADRHALAHEIRRALTLCRTGAMLSNNGRIEAAYGTSMLEEMRTIVVSIEEIMSQTVTGLKSLNHTFNQ